MKTDRREMWFMVALTFVVTGRALPISPAAACGWMKASP